MRPIIPFAVALAGVALALLGTPLAWIGAGIGGAAAAAGPAFADRVDRRGIFRLAASGAVAGVGLFGFLVLVIGLGYPELRSRLAAFGAGPVVLLIAVLALHDRR